VISEIGTVEAVAQSEIEADVMSEVHTADKWVFDCHVDGSACHAREISMTQLWKDCVKWKEDTYPCPGQGCTEKLKLVNDSHGAHVRLKRQVKPFGKNKWEHAYVVIPTCSKCNTSYNDLTRECIAVKVADLDENGRVVYVGSITQDGHTVHLLEDVILEELSVEDVEGSVGLKHLNKEQLNVLKEKLIVWPVGKDITEEQLEVFEKKLNRRDIPLFSEVRILFSRLMVSRKKAESESDILKLLKPQKKELLKHGAFGKHSDESLSKLNWHLERKLLESCFKKRGAFKLFGNTPGKSTRSGAIESERVTLKFDNDATDGFIRKLVTPPSTSMSPIELKEWKKNRSKTPGKWKGRKNIVLEVRGTEQYPETTASDIIIEHLKEILKDVVDKQSALQVVKQYCEIELERAV
jgi:hypothetical protein